MATSLKASFIFSLFLASISFSLSYQDDPQQQQQKCHQECLVLEQMEEQQQKGIGGQGHEGEPQIRECHRSCDRQHTWRRDLPYEEQRKKHGQCRAQCGQQCVRRCDEQQPYLQHEIQDLHCRQLCGQTLTHDERGQICQQRCQSQQSGDQQQQQQQQCQSRNIGRSACGFVLGIYSVVNGWECDNIARECAAARTNYNLENKTSIGNQEIPSRNLSYASKGANPGNMDHKVNNNSSSAVNNADNN
ncbi:vicilin-like antimicrobial peptides 2-1 [Rosa chinensis]|uniref:vicilin-like antimicrobial peptides 2-1 n=1 Tax=Rosa chinensis TaxID=74649 RepID=UPI000D087F16|nr:vicilin-like antimicrobial peptides 2-1 [Rosa chinensis]